MLMVTPSVAITYGTKVVIAWIGLPSVSPLESEFMFFGSLVSSTVIVRLSRCETSRYSALSLLQELNACDRAAVDAERACQGQSCRVEEGEAIAVEDDHAFARRRVQRDCGGHAVQPQFLIRLHRFQAAQRGGSST